MKRIRTMDHPNFELGTHDLSLLTRDASVDGIDQNRFGTLNWAIFNGQRKIIDSLLESNTPVNNLVHCMRDFRLPLHSSVYLEDPDIVRRLLDRGASVNATDRNHETALTLAAKLGKYALVDIMLSEERLKNCANKDNLTHFHIACMRNRVDIVRKLVECGTNINTPVDSKSIRWPGFSPLHFAVQFQCIETIAFLLSVGADITIQDSNELTALHLADMMRNNQIIDMILVKHERVAHNPINLEGLSHFHIACTRNNTEIVESFLKNGVNMGDSVPSSSLNWSEYTALDFAVYYDCVDVVKLLLMEGGRRIFPTRQRGEPFDRLSDAYCSGNVELIDLFLQRDDLEKDESKAIQKLPPLHYSCIYDNLEIVKKSLTKTPNELNTLSWQGSSPLHLAIERGDEAIIEYLLNQGAEWHVKNADDKTGLHLAFERGMNDIIGSILSDPECIKENAADNNGFSNLHISCITNNEDAVKRLIKLGADVNAPVNVNSASYPGFTPLHFAAKFGSAQVARKLLEHGASYSVSDKNGLSAFDVAVYELQKFNQKNSHDLFSIMREILSSHQKRKIDSFNDRGFSLLHVVCPGLRYETDPKKDDYRQDLEKFILQHPGDMDKAIHRLNTPWDGYTPFHFAMMDHDPQVANLLVKMGANAYSEAANGNTPMHLSAVHYVIPKIPEGPLYNPMGTRGESLFHVACSAGNKQWVEYFLNHGVDPNSRTTVQGLEVLDKAPLHLVTRSLSGPKLSIIKLLLEKGADATVRDHYLNTPLHYMTGQVEPEVIELLISHGVDVDSRNAFLETPLLSICKTSLFKIDSSLYFLEADHNSLCEKIVSLLDHGADINVVDERGITPMTIDTWTNLDKSDKFLPAIQVLLKHVIKLKTIGLHLSDENEKAYLRLSQYPTVKLRSKLSHFGSKCKKELDLMKQISTGKHTTLYDILLKDLNGLLVMGGNDELKKIIDSDDLTKKYPIYGPMLKLQVKKGEEKKRIVSDATKVLKSLMNILRRASTTEMQRTTFEIFDRLKSVEYD